MLLRSTEIHPVLLRFVKTFPLRGKYPSLCPGGDSREGPFSSLSHGLRCRFCVLLSALTLAMQCVVCCVLCAFLRDGLYIPRWRAAIHMHSKQVSKYLEAERCWPVRLWRESISVLGWVRVQGGCGLGLKGRKVPKGPKGGVRNVHRHLLPCECMHCVHSNGLGVKMHVFRPSLGFRG